MAGPDERKQMGTAAGLHHRLGQSGIATPEREFGGGESHSARPCARLVKIFMRLGCIARNPTGKVENITTEYSRRGWPGPESKPVRFMEKATNTGLKLVKMASISMISTPPYFNSS